MGLKSTMKKGLFSGLNPKQWIGFNQLQSDSKTLGSIAKSVFQRSKEAEKKETFEEALKRFNLTEEDLKKRMHSAKQLVMIFVAFGGALFAYMIYQWSSGHFTEGFICLILSALTLSYAFREHFNLFQMRQRRLGCTYKEWFKSTFMGSK